ncbi:MAG: isocitrate lyase/phosphoenolpyruvate mutase family protein [Propionibacterium sp.]|nr:isocitrate lyase/phosphoenolpyruvate mutase family protein [Propionibacterium sp.]
MLRDAEPLGCRERTGPCRHGIPGAGVHEAGFTWSSGRPDNTVGPDETLARLRIITAEVGLPGKADFQNGSAAEPEGVAANVGLAVRTCVAGLSIEAFSGDPARPLLEVDLAVGCLQSARAAIDASGLAVVFTARSEGLVRDRADIDGLLSSH